MDFLRFSGSPALLMASRRALPTDLKYLLDLISDLPNESHSNDDFEGYLDPENGPVAYRGAAELLEGCSTRSQSLEDFSGNAWTWR